MAPDQEDEKPLRLFVAVDVPEATLDVVDELAAAWRERLAGAGRWVPRENQHVTTAFLGRTWPRLVGWVQDRVAAAVAGVRPFETGLAALGVVPSRTSARVLWVGLDERGGGWDALAAGLRDALAPEFPPDRRPYTPHLTLARFEPRVSFADHRQALGEPVEAPRFRVGHVTLYRSHLM
ncbi:MAG: RNA 2',3'-cyclic phosphodiesterase, partial [Actinomycetota bacterium]